MANTLVAETREGHFRVTYWDVDGPASYALDGPSINASDLGLGQIVAAQAGGSDNGDHFASAVVQAAAGKTGASVKVQWFVMSTGAEVAATTDLSARRIRLRLVTLN